jgi:hypothetical protein
MRKPVMIAVITGAAVLAIAAIITTVVLITSNNAGTSSSSDTPPTTGCTETTTEEIYVQHVYTCPDGTRVYTFATTAARDDYLKAAEHFGAVTIEKGATWAKVRI